MATPAQPKRMLLGMDSLLEDPASKSPHCSRGNVIFLRAQTMVYGFLARGTRPLSTAELRVSNGDYGPAQAHATRHGQSLGGSSLKITKSSLPAAIFLVSIPTVRIGLPQ